MHFRVFMSLVTWLPLPRMHLPIAADMLIPKATLKSCHCYGAVTNKLLIPSSALRHTQLLPHTSPVHGAMGRCFHRLCEARGGSRLWKCHQSPWPAPAQPFSSFFQILPQAGGETAHRHGHPPPQALTGTACPAYMMTGCLCSVHSWTNSQQAPRRMRI